jgi:uncharacterized membrane protein YoaK (UPF0700 family)
MFTLWLQIGGLPGPQYQFGRVRSRHEYIYNVGGQYVSLGFMAGNLNNLGQHLAMGIKRAPVGHARASWDRYWLWAAVLAGIWSAFVLGAGLGEAFAARLANWVLLLLALMLLVFAMSLSVSRDFG